MAPLLLADSVVWDQPLTSLENDHNDNLLGGGYVRID
jgi:hypothetical protein